MTAFAAYDGAVAYHTRERIMLRDRVRIVSDSRAPD
jgi:hypothetical protein